MVDKLILCDTAQKIGNDESWNQRIQTVRRQGLHTISGDIIKRWFSNSFYQKFPEKVAGYKNMLERCQADAYIRTCESIRDIDLSNMMRQLHLPCLCLVGEGDLSTVPADVQYMASLIPDAGYQVIKDSGHVPSVDNPEIFSRLIIDFIN
jgi:pimeloyl-ACP methyl ester carboxylesterase